jgi:hypothetical protein
MEKAKGESELNITNKSGKGTSANLSGNPPGPGNREETNDKGTYTFQRNERAGKDQLVRKDEL